MEIIYNGAPVQLPDGLDLARALQTLAAQEPFAAAVNGAFVPKSQYAAQPLRPADRVDLLTPVAGG